MKRKKKRKDYFKDYSFFNLVTKQTFCMYAVQNKTPYQYFNQSLRPNVGTDERTGLQTQSVGQEREKLANGYFSYPLG